MLHSRSRTSQMIDGRADAVVGASAAFMVVNAGFVIVTAAFVPGNAALAVVRAACVRRKFQRATSIRPEPGKCERSAFSAGCAGLERGPGGNRKAPCAGWADRAFPVLRVGFCEVRSKGNRGVGEYEGTVGQGLAVPLSDASLELVLVPAMKSRSLGSAYPIAAQRGPWCAPLGMTSPGLVAR